MKRRTYLSILALFATSAVQADIQVKDHWARASQGPNSALFMVIENPDAQDDQLVEVKVNQEGFCDRTELHAHVEENGIMKMRPVENIQVPAGGLATLKPGGLHVMFMDMSGPITEKDTVPVTLVFASGQTVDLDVPVKPAVARKN